MTNFNDTYDFTNDFETLLNQWQNYPEGYKVLPADQAAMITAAENARSASTWMWATLSDVLCEHGLFKSDKAAHREVRRCRVQADLGEVPQNTRHLVEIWLKANGYTMEFDGSFLQGGHLSGHDRDYLGKKLKLWVDDTKMFTVNAVDNAFDVWMVDAKEKIQAQTFHNLRYDATIDPTQSELAKFVRMIIAPAEVDDEDDEVAVQEANEKTALIHRAAEVSFANFIYRVKNHMRGSMKNSCHMMPILQGKQGDGKSEAILAFCRPLGNMATSTSFEAFGDNSMTYQFSVMPVMIFEEMAGAGKADVEKLKSIMTETSKQMREAYARAGTRRIISTFIASSNKDISGLIKDETGNRRLIQFKTQPIDRQTIRESIDYAKIWQSVDEDAYEPPKFANAQDLAAIEILQDEQRFTSPVEDWINDGNDYGIAWHNAVGIKSHWSSFVRYMGDTAEGELRYWSMKRLKVTLMELAQAGRVKIRVTRSGNSNDYCLTQPDHLKGQPVSERNGDVYGHLRSVK